MRREDKAHDEGCHRLSRRVEGGMEEKWNQDGRATGQRMRRIMCIDSPENGKTFAAGDRLGRILLAGQVRPEAVEDQTKRRGDLEREKGVAGSSCVRRYARLAGHWLRSFTAWLTICPPRTAFGTELPHQPSALPFSLVAGCRRDVYYLN